MKLSCKLIDSIQSVETREETKKKQGGEHMRGGRIEGLIAERERRKEDRGKARHEKWTPWPGSDRVVDLDGVRCSSLSLSPSLPASVIVVTDRNVTQLCF